MVDPADEQLVGTPAPRGRRRTYAPAAVRAMPELRATVSARLAAFDRRSADDLAPPPAPTPPAADASAAPPMSLAGFAGTYEGVRPVGPHKPSPARDGRPRPAAVAICLIEHEGTPSFLVIRRARAGRHAGQWALPGGRLDDGETPVTAALRELEEEAGVSAGPGDVVGVLDDFLTVSGFVMTPVVVVAEPQPLRPDPVEVARLFAVPVSRLLHAFLRWGAEGGHPLLGLQIRRDMVIHPPTAAILLQFRDVALRGHDVRVSGLVQPRFTHR